MEPKKVKQLDSYIKYLFLYFHERKAEEHLH
jgi:hypothetical protein